MKFTSLFALILIEILLCSSFCLCHEVKIFQGRERRSLSRRLLSIPVVSVSPSRLSTSSGAMKEPKKAVESSMRRKPPSGSNPIQNKQLPSNAYRRDLNGSVHIIFIYVLFSFVLFIFMVLSHFLEIYVYCVVMKF